PFLQHKLVNRRPLKMRLFCHHKREGFHFSKVLLMPLRLSLSPRLPCKHKHLLSQPPPGNCRPQPQGNCRSQKLSNRVPCFCDKHAILCKCTIPARPLLRLSKHCKLCQTM